jgi:hypothetical protein
MKSQISARLKFHDATERGLSAKHSMKKLRERRTEDDSMKTNDKGAEKQEE